MHMNDLPDLFAPLLSSSQMEVFDESTDGRFDSRRASFGRWCPLSDLSRHEMPRQGIRRAALIMDIGRVSRPAAAMVGRTVSRRKI
jgi:hypothetical protein